ncbi:hypothetical protein Hanom_Chr16g01469901 [Helianthus anomalus]
MNRNITGIRKDMFLMDPRFLQIILNARYPDLERGGNTMDLKSMGPNCFRALALKKKTVGHFQGKIPLEKFGQFLETEDVVNAPVNVEIAEEHDVQTSDSKRRRA